MSPYLQATRGAVDHRVPHVRIQRGRGRVVQAEPIKPTLKAPGTERLKLKCDELLSNFTFKFNLRRYNEDRLEAGAYTCPLFGST